MEWDEESNKIVSLGQDLVTQLLSLPSLQHSPLACVTLSFFFSVLRQAGRQNNEHLLKTWSGFSPK